MQNYIDYREIVQTVTQNVMTEIVNKLNAMKPGIEQEIANSVTNAINSRLVNLENRLNNMQTRLTALEQKQSSGTSYTTSSASQYTPPAPPSNAELLKKIKWWSHKTLRGWIFYINQDDGDFLYMIREDGSGNKQLTNYSVSGISSLAVNGSSCTLELWVRGDLEPLTVQL